MRTVLALAALAAAAASSAQAQSTCTNSSLAFITETTGPFAQICAAAVTAPALTPYSATVSLTTLLDPTSSVTSFLVSSPVTTAVNAALAGAIQGVSLTLGKSYNFSTLAVASQGSFSAYPASSQNPYGYNYTRILETLTVATGNAVYAKAYVDAINGTVLGASNFVLCPVLKNITQSLIGCVPSACNNLALNLCNNPTQANAASLMGSYADKPFTAGTLTILANIGASCGGAYLFFTDAKSSQLVTLLQSLGYNVGATASTFDVSCSVLANPALAGTFQYPTTKSPTTKSSGAVVGAGVLAAVAAVASVVAF